MNEFGDFLYELRKEKGLTQAELAQILGVTNKAVSKWETGEAMPETSQFVPIAQTFGVTVDELLKGRRAEKPQPAVENNAEDGAALEAEIKKLLFTRGDDEEPRTLADKICGAICGALMFAALLTYLLLGGLANLWHPYWVILPAAALVCGIIGVIGDVLNPSKRAKKLGKGENPYTGCACGIIILTCITAFLLSAALTGLWHPLWIIVVAGVAACFIVGAAGDLFTHKKK